MMTGSLWSCSCCGRSVSTISTISTHNIYAQYLHQVHSLLPGSESHDWETVVRNAEEYSRTYTRLDRYLPHPHGILGFYNFYIDTNRKYLK